MNKILFFLITIIVNYILLTFLIYLFSYISLINGKTYDLFWIKSIQERLYTRGIRNIWQYNSECVKFDKDLLYAPKDGECNFDNPEFNTILNFNNGIRVNSLNKDYNFDDQFITIIGDSISMGWGVNDEQTFSSLLEKKINKNVINMGVSSYGTVREIKKLVSSKYYNQSDLILIQYHHNDIYENELLDFKKEYSFEEFRTKTDKDLNNQKKVLFFLKTFKTSLRLFFSDLNDKLNPEANRFYIDFNDHAEILEKLIYDNLDFLNKRIIVFFIKKPNMKIFNFPNSNKSIEYHLINLNSDDFFVIDEHPNSKGHLKISNSIYEIIK